MHSARPFARSLNQVAFNCLERREPDRALPCESLRGQLLEHGHRAFFDRIEGYGPAGWRLHFFCLDPAAVTVLHNMGRERAVQVIPLRSILRSSSSGGSDKWNRLVAGRPNEWWDLDV